MPVYLQVRQVRDAIYQQALRTPTVTAEQNTSSNKAIGGLFHEAVASLFSSDPEFNCAPHLMRVQRSPDSWKASIRNILYRNKIGPYVTRNQAGLQRSSSEILALWQAIDNFSEWLSVILWRAHQELAWPNAESPLITCEDELSWTLREPGWTDSVQLTGIADLVLRIPQRDKRSQDWCVVEFKLGRTSPEADLAQACLYHEMLLASVPVPPEANSLPGTLALVSFTPALHERLFDTPQLADARQKLKTLIGSLAGVTGQSVAEVPPPAKPSSSPKLEEMEALLLKTFHEFSAPAERAGEAIAGPAFFRFFFAPSRGIKTRKIIDLADEIQVRLKLNAPPIIGLSGGRITVDVERPDREVVHFSDIRAQLPLSSARGGSSILPVGVDLSGCLVVADLAETKHTHILVVGTTGSGKSEWLRTAIAALILGNTPQTLQLILIDPKRTAFGELANSAFLRDGGIVYPAERSVSTILEGLVDEMESRYLKMQSAGVEDLKGLNAAGYRLPRIVCVCDEYADLLTGSKHERAEVERQITRLGSKARAAGIHLIIATQEARRETIRGSLDANLPARVGLRTNKDIESRLLLQENGAERLLGHGDLLFKDIGAAVRLQAPILTAKERETIFRS